MIVKGSKRRIKRPRSDEVDGVYAKPLPMAVVVVVGY
jgi:hypothetical protein